MRIATLVLGGLLFLCLLPLLIALAAAGLAGPMGCEGDGPALRGCTAFGADWSDALTMATTLHWLGLITLPLAALLTLALILLALVHGLRRLRR